MAIVRCSDPDPSMLDMDVRGVETEDFISSMSSSESSSAKVLMSCSSTATHCSTKVLKEMCRLLDGPALLLLLVGGKSKFSPLLGVWLAELARRGGLFRLFLVRKMFESDLVLWGVGRSTEPSSESMSSSSLLVDSRIGEAGMGMVSISESVRCFRIGFFAGPPRCRITGRSMPKRSSVVATLRGRTGSTWAVCSGPYSQVTSESLSLECEVEGWRIEERYDDRRDNRSAMPSTVALQLALLTS